MSSETITQPTKSPTRKVTSGTMGAGGTALVMWLVDVIWGLQMPEPAAGAVVGLAFLAFAYFTKERAVAVTGHTGSSPGGTVTGTASEGGHSEPSGF